MPLGRPVVPDEYSIDAPSDSSAMGVVGKGFTASSRSRTAAPSPGPSTTRLTLTLGHCCRAAKATARSFSENRSTCDSLLSTM